jgi:hypothetical protein
LLWTGDPNAENSWGKEGDMIKHRLKITSETKKILVSLGFLSHKITAFAEESQLDTGTGVP